MCLGDADESRWTGFPETRNHAPKAHPGIDDHRHRAGLEKGEDQGKKIQARRHHHDRSRSPAHAGSGQAPGDGVGFAIELSKRQVDIGRSALPVATGRTYRGFFVGLHPGHSPQV
jgi:hypothetical protein